MIIFDSSQQGFKDLSEVEELSGKLANEDEEDKLMHSVLESDKDEVDDGKVIVESINQGISSFMPDMMFRNIVNNYQLAEKLYGETLIRRISGYDPSYVKKNINIPEFQRELKSNISSRIEKMKKKGLLDKEGSVTSEALKLSSIVLYMEELDRLVLKGFGERKEKKRDPYGDREGVKNFSGHNYRDVDVRKSLKVAARRQHRKITGEDLRAHERVKKGKIDIIYALDASGSMKGGKIGSAKRAGVALAFKAIQERNNVGLLVFGSELKSKVLPCQDFRKILEELTKVQASMETDLAGTIKASVDCFRQGKSSKHLIILTDALPTAGEEPVEETLEAASMARDAGITISVIGFNLDKNGLKVAKRISDIGDGRLYTVKDLENLDTLVLEEYYEVA